MIKRKDFPDDMFYCVDYNPQGTSFAVGSKEADIRVIDDETFNVSEKMLPVDGDRAGHSNIIFSVNYLNEH